MWTTHKSHLHWQPLYMANNGRAKKKWKTPLCLVNKWKSTKIDFILCFLRVRVRVRMPHKPSAAVAAITIFLWVYMCLHSISSTNNKDWERNFCAITEMVTNIHSNSQHSIEGVKNGNRKVMYENWNVLTSDSLHV